MNKITIMARDKYAARTVEALRKLGILHIKHMQQPHADYITSIENKLSDLNKAISLIKQSKEQDKEIDKKTLFSYEKEIIDLAEQKQRCIEKKQKINEKLLWFKEWGDISLRSITALEAAGVFIKFYLCSQSEFKKITPDKQAYVIGQRAKQLKVVLVSINKEEALNFIPVEPPAESKFSLERKNIVAARHLEKINKRLEEFSKYRKSFLEHKRGLLKNLEFCEVRFGMAQREGISCLQGFCPKESVSQIKKAAMLKGWAIMIEEPAALEETPTLVRYPSWVKIIKPIFDLMGTLPGYKEYDISPWFLLFFSLFFAMLIGDAGYGFIFLGMTLLVRKKLSKAPKLPFFLMYTLSIGTIIWGAVTGNWFGCEKIAQLPFFSSLIIDNLNTFIAANENTLMHLCFIVAALQLSLAHTLAALRHSNSLKGLAQVGWIGIIWGIYFLVINLVLDKTFPVFANYLLASGVGLVILFSNFQKNIFKGIIIGIANLPLKLINSFADTLSYLRLFAIGYVSVMIAASFNEMAQAVGFSSILTSLGSALILLAGHTLNIILGLMSVLVHGVRLNMLEFSGHLDMEWAGIEYKPFKE